MLDPPNSESEDRSSPKDFARRHDYTTLKLGARRKAAPHIGTPAITRHLGFWIPDGLTLKRAHLVSSVYILAHCLRD
jgi:hypothetical protein